MLKYKVGDKVKVNDKLNINFDDSEDEALLIGHVGKIIDAVETGAFPYEVKFEDEKIQEINMNMGSRLFDEYELDLVYNGLTKGLIFDEFGKVKIELL